MPAMAPASNQSRYNIQKTIDHNNVGPIPPTTLGTQLRADCDDSLLKFLLICFKSAFPLKMSADHLKIIAEIEQRILFGGLKAICMPRGSGKTTIILRAALWAILAGHRKWCCIVAANEYAAVGNLSTIKNEINFNDKLAEIYPTEIHCIKSLHNEPRRTGQQHYNYDLTGVEYSTRRIDFGTIPGSVSNGGIISTAGITGQIRGQQKNTVTGLITRPDLALVEDPQTKSSAASNSQCKKRHETMMGDVLGMAGPGVDIAGFCTGTVIYKNDVMDRLLNMELSPDWNGSRVPMLKSWPKNMSLWDDYNLIRIRELTEGDLTRQDSGQFVVDNHDRLHEGAQVYWDDRKGKEDVSAVHHAMDLFYRDQAVFASEYQNAPMSGAEIPPYDINAERLARRVVGVPRGKILPETHTITAFIDVQKELLYYCVVAWTLQGGGYIIDYGACPDQQRYYFSKGEIRFTLQDEFGDELETALRGGLSWLTEAIMETDYRAEDGSTLQVQKCAIDARWGESTHIIRKFVRASKYRSRLHPSMGMYIGATSRPWQKLKIDKKDKKGVHAKLQVPKEAGQRELYYDTNFWKSFAADRLLCETASPRAIVLFDAPPHEHRMFSEHCSYEEAVKCVGKAGNEVVEWKTERFGHLVENDLWDCLVGNCALASILGIETHKGNSARGNINTAIDRVRNRKPKSQFFRPR